jgi:hypothetical protein
MADRQEKYAAVISRTQGAVQDHLRTKTLAFSIGKANPHHRSAPRLDIMTDAIENQFD